MSIFSGWRRIAIFAAAMVTSVAWMNCSANKSFAQGAGSGSAASANGKSETDMLIGSYVSGADSGQYKDVTDAITRFKNGAIGEARELLNQAVKDNPNKLPPAEVMLARMILSVGQLAPAQAQLEQATRSYPKDPEAYLMFAELALQEGHITDADALLAKVQPLVTTYNDNPKRKKFLESHLYADQANVDVARTDWDSAVDHAKQWLKTDPDSVQGHQLLARALFKQGLDRDAYSELVAASKIDPKTATNPYIYMALLHEESTKSDKHERATKMIEAAIKEKPKDLNTLLQAAQWALQTSTNTNNGLSEAKNYADQALAVDSKSDEAKMVRAQIARLTGDLNYAEKLLSQVVQDSPSNIAASNQLALVLIETGDKEKMNKALQIAQVNMQLTTKGNQFSPEVASTYAWVLYKNDRKKEAGEILTKVLQSTRQASPDMAYYLGKMLQDAGEFDKAQQILKAAADNPSPFAQRQATIQLLAEVEKQQKEKSKDDKGGKATESK